MLSGKLLKELATVAIVLASVGASAQTNGTSSFAQLPPAEQKIVRALFEAQTGPTRLTPDQITGMKKVGERWGHVFQQMKEQGLLRQKNLGQVVTDYERRVLGTRKEKPPLAGPAKGLAETPK